MAHSGSVGGHDKSDYDRYVDEGHQVYGFDENQPMQTTDEVVEENTDFEILFPRIGRDNSINCLIRCSRSDYGIVSALNRNFQSLGKSNDLYALRRVNGITEQWVYFSCNFQEWDAFDPNSRRWKHLPSMNCHEIFICVDKESLGVGPELLVIGREMLSQVMYCYSVVTNAWSLGPHMNEPRWLFGSASSGNIGIFAGGCNVSGKILSSVELYNSETGTWTLLPSMNMARKLCSGVFIDGKFYVVGGIGESNNELLSSGEKYDFETRTWIEIPNMSPVTTYEHRYENGVQPLIAVVENQMYAADQDKMELKKYDKENEEWNVIGKLPNNTSHWGMIFRACGNMLIVISGSRTISGMRLIDFNSWIPSSDGPVEWTLLGSRISGNFVNNCAIVDC